MHRNNEGYVGPSIFATGGDKTDKIIHLWDICTLRSIDTLRGHRGDIRALEFSPDGRFLFSGGQGGVLVWDLRKTTHPVDSIEKTMDVFSLKSNEASLFIGCRNHSIIPVDLKVKQGHSFSENAHAPFKPPHYDVVTAFATLLD
mmetsp:Transcript_22050/g.34210  ORF Transcript_22050/g.34210 Transcript_22050/m.34210 type:complete len:144 (-) Transcript_22050:440-871(-)